MRSDWVVSIIGRENQQSRYVDSWDMGEKRRMEVCAENWQGGIPPNCNEGNFASQDSVMDVLF